MGLSSKGVKVKIGMGEKVTAKPQINRTCEVKIGVKGYLSATVIRKDGSKEVVADRVPNLITNAGFEFISDKVYENTDSKATEQACHVGLSQNTTLDLTTSAARSATSMPGELTANGLGRQSITGASGQVNEYSRSGNVSKHTLKTIFAATGGTNNNIGRSAIFSSATSGGTMVHIADFTSPFNLGGGDSVEVTWEITLAESA